MLTKKIDLNFIYNLIKYTSVIIMIFNKVVFVNNIHIMINSLNHVSRNKLSLAKLFCLVAKLFYNTTVRRTNIVR